MNTSPHIPARESGTQHRRSRITLIAALIWSLGLATASVLWITGIVGAPFGTFIAADFAALIDALPTTVASLLICVVGIVGVGIAATALTRRDAPPVTVLAVFAGVLALFSTVIVADAKVMAVIGYALSFRLVPLNAPLILQLAMLLGSAIWIAAAVRAPAGRIVAVDGRRPSALAKAAVAVAVAIPLIYAAVRFAWAAGIPLGISDQMLADGQESGLWTIGLGLASVATAVALLTLGLVQRWGERLPRWVPSLGGRRVPIALAAVPVTIGGLAIFAGGVMFVRVVSTGTFPLGENWATVGPELLWPLWGIALAVALVEYLRRRVRIDRPATNATIDTSH
ncbi:hypothetical protein [Paramicrobacterium fandaimingii]|uniref:hypothetical protein n=1 Tax=Paramicrobacterium fandaimingii TaxID=2708079 RepID=UPI001423DB14|nr:hypothetical protein [Microbacterium fandaimingii]